MTRTTLIKLFCLAIVCILIIPMVVACGDETQSPTSSSEAAAEKIEITFNPNRGYIVDGNDIVKVDKGGKVKNSQVPEVERDGYDFLGWSYRRNDPDLDYEWFASDKFDEETTLYAIWEKDDTENNNDGNNSGNNSTPSTGGNNESNNTPSDSHTHTYGKWTATKQATCTQTGKEERMCNCGAKESREVSANGHRWSSATCTKASTCSVCQATNGDALGHTTNSGVCTRCGIEYYSDYELALKKLNEEYKKQKDQLITLEATISAKENILNSVLDSLGISYLNSKSYYNSQLNSIQTQLSNKNAQYMAALRAGEQTKAIQLQREISQLEEQYSICYQASMLCDSKTEIDQLKAQYEQLKYSIERDYQQKLNELNKQYN